VKRRGCQAKTRISSRSNQESVAAFESPTPRISSPHSSEEEGICAEHPVTGRARQSLGSFSFLCLVIGAACGRLPSSCRGPNGGFPCHVLCSLIAIHLSTCAYGMCASHLRINIVQCLREDGGLQTLTSSAVRTSAKIRSCINVAARHRQQSTTASSTLSASCHKGHKQPSSQPTHPYSASAHVQKRKPK
jgi:hypothetical protein